MDEVEEVQLVRCLHCCRFAGCRRDGKYFVLVGEVESRPRRVRVGGVGLGESDLRTVLREVVAEGSRRLVDVVTSERRVKKSELESFSGEWLGGETQGVVVVHRATGRLLLSDENGLYRRVYEESLRRWSRLE